MCLHSEFTYLLPNFDITLYKTNSVYRPTERGTDEVIGTLILVLRMKNKSDLGTSRCTRRLTAMTRKFNLFLLKNTT